MAWHLFRGLAFQPIIRRAVRGVRRLGQRGSRFGSANSSAEGRSAHRRPERTGRKRPYGCPAAVPAVLGVGPEHASAILPRLPEVAAPDGRPLRRPLERSDVAATMAGPADAWSPRCWCWRRICAALYPGDGLLLRHQGVLVAVAAVGELSRSLSFRCDLTLPLSEILSLRAPPCPRL